MARRTKGLDLGRSTGIPCRTGHQGPGGQDDPARDHVAQGMASEGEYCHEGHHGGQPLDTGAPVSVPPRGYAAKRYQAASPVGSPSGVSKCRSTRPYAAKYGMTTIICPLTS